MRIPDHIIEDIRRATDIVDIVSGAVKLKRRGKNFIGLCPFHQEKTPSFNVNPEMQIYKCFGCGKGGNVYHFLMETEKLTFVEAVRSLAERAGIMIPEGESDRTNISELDRLHQILSFAGKHFYDNLTKTDEGRGALEYFRKREFGEDTIRSFGLGYSLNSWDTLLKKTQSEGFLPGELERAGLVRKREDGSAYDLFRGRAMFPILLANGKVAGFGARKIRDDDAIQGKYINSPDSEVYNKSRILFGLSHAKNAIRQEESAVLVEGYADMISLFQAGIQNVVASSGTALTEDQLRLLGRYSKNLVLLFDGDSAGSKAAVRGIDIALEQDFDIRVVELPQGHDPDSFVRSDGAEGLRQRMKGAKTFIDFKASLFARSGMMDDSTGKTKAVRSIVSSIASMRDELKQAFALKEVAERYGLYESVLQKELERQTTAARKSPPPTAPPASSAGSPVTVVEGPVPPIDRQMLRVFVSGHMQAIDHVLTNLRETDISDTRVTRILHHVLAQIDRNGTVSVASLLDSVDEPDLVPIIMDASMNKYELSKAWSESEKEIEQEDMLKVARDVVLRVHERALRQEIEANRRAMDDAKRTGGDVSNLLRVHHDLSAALHKSDREQK